MPTASSKVIYPALSYAVTGACFDVHNELGRFAKEKHYGNLLEKKLKERKIPYQREVRITATGDFIDFVIDETIIVELKAKNVLLKTDYYQIQRYLHALDKKLGLLVNFRNRYLKPVRVLNSEAN